MNRRKLLIALSVSYPILFLSDPAYADMKKIDKGSRSWSSQTGYWVMFLARDYTPGHAFIVWGIRGRKSKSWRSLRGYGLYPKAAQKLGFGTVPGSIVRENTKSLASANTGLAVAVTKRMYDYSFENTKILSNYSEDYNLFSKNCVHFVDEISRSLSLKTPAIPKTGKLPQKYIESLKTIN